MKRHSIAIWQALDDRSLGLYDTERLNSFGPTVSKLPDGEVAEAKVVVARNVAEPTMSWVHIPLVPRFTMSASPMGNLARKKGQKEVMWTQPHREFQSNPTGPTTLTRVSWQCCCVLGAIGLLCGVSGFAWLVVSFLGSQVTGSSLRSHGGPLKSIYVFDIEPSLAENYQEVMCSS
jgi:hypothetical protein